MKIIFGWERDHHLARVCVFLITAVLIVGTVSCTEVPVVTLTITSTEGGDVIAPGEGTFTYNEGIIVNLVAEADEGYYFVNWAGNVSTVVDVEAASTNITMNDDYNIIANFNMNEAPKIWDWYDLDTIRDDLSGTYILMNDLDSDTPGYGELASPTANGGMGWEPIGNIDNKFTGTLDGQGYDICDLFINRPYGNYIALFGYVSEGGVAKNLGMVNATVTSYGGKVGGLVGANYGTVSNSYLTGNVTGRLWVGGLVGDNRGTVSNSYSNGSVTSGGGAGGLVGGNAGTVSNSYSSANVTGEVVVGGLVGANYPGTVSNSYSNGSVAGNVSVGGLVGQNDGTVIRSYSTSNVTGYEDVGGLVGCNTGFVSNSFWDTETSGQTTSDGGTGKTTAEMQDIDTFSGATWDIIAVGGSGERNPTYIWNIVDDVTYPFLSWQP